jgi:DNA helicase-2/ATP-dependent DNA helicase PcrA
LIENKVERSDQILALTFTEKAAGEMEERIDKALPYGYTDLWVSTFHAFGERILKSHGLDIGVPYDFKLLTETEQWLLIRKHLDKFNLDYYKPLGNPTKFIHALLRHFSRAKDEEIYPEQYLAYAVSIKLDKDKTEDVSHDEVKRICEVADAYHVYQQILLDEQALDFGDLINYSLKVFRERPEILKRYQEQFKYVLVDEFQDTNWAQYELIKLLASPKNNLTVVGDDDQSIYRFRGASMSNILQFRQDYLDTKNIVLTKNYRSSQNILDVSYKFIQQNNPNRLEFQLQQSNSSLEKKLMAQSSEAGIISHLHGERASDEEQLIVEKIKQLKKADKKARWSDFAILARSNDVANEFDAVLERTGIPHISYTSKGLYRKSCIVDAISYLKLLDNYHESTAVWRVLNFSYWEIEPHSLVQLSHEANKKSESLYETLLSADALGVKQSDKDKFRKISELIQSHASLARDHKPSEVLVKVLADIGYTAHIDSLDEALAKQEFDFLNQLYQRIKRWENTQTDPRLRDFLEAFKYELESGEEGDLTIDPEIGPDTVKIMTVHAAKGLEFNYVFIVNLVAQRFPTIRRRDPIKLPEGDIHTEEERRLFYVAMTRAKRGLFFTSAEDYGGARKKKISQFMSELDLQLTESKKISTSSEWQTAKFPERVQDSDLAQYIPDYFSFTALKAFETCPFQYRYSHILKVPVWGRHTFSFGQSMHLALEKFFERFVLLNEEQQENLFGNKVQDAKTAPSLKELLKLYEESWINEWYSSKALREQYYQKGKKALTDFYKKHQNNWPDVKSVERGFTLKIGPYSLKGKVDRIDNVEGGVTITDYKTGKPKSEKDIDKDQLLIYQMAAKQVWKEEPKELTFYYLDDNSEVAFLGTEEELNKMQKKVVGLIEQMYEGDFSPKPSKQTCQFCDFNSICPYSKA